MAARWSAQEHKTLESLLADGVDTNLLKKHLPERSLNAIHRKALKYDYGVKNVNGDTKLYSGKRTRVHKKKVEEEVLESRKKIVGETRTTTNSSTPTMITFEQTTQNVSDVIVADSTCNFNGDAFIHLYADIGKLLSSEQYKLKCITVTLEDTVLKVSRGTI
jgi:hypothetical protein